MEKAKYSFYRIKDKILEGNKILFNEREVKIMLQELIEIFVILKNEKIVHNDIHLGNILIGFDNKIKLCDFAFSYFYKESIEKDNIPRILPKLHKFEGFIATELYFWCRKLSDADEGIRYNPFKADIFSIGLCILFLIHPDFKDIKDFQNKKFDDFNAEIYNKKERRFRDRIILKFFKLGANNFKLEYPQEYSYYIKYTLELQQKIYNQIESLSGYNSIKEILREMLKVHFPDRENIEDLLVRIKRINFDISYDIFQH